MAQFYDCESESVSYNVMGIATVNYTIISDNPEPTLVSSINIGDTLFTGVITNYNTQPIQKSENSEAGTWYTTAVTLVATS